ncbi:uncharacterized protein BDV17DRAFT_256764 [Aspergillus undulatus]|uniref:uncharacterized protein n=1 Tax=Aspergillus undulatus TaxID=1810928 RepID=UPI003CCE4E20
MQATTWPVSTASGRFLQSWHWLPFHAAAGCARTLVGGPFTKVWGGLCACSLLKNGENNSDVVIGFAVCLLLLRAGLRVRHVL